MEISTTEKNEILRELTQERKNLEISTTEKNEILRELIAKRELIDSERQSNKLIEDELKLLKNSFMFRKTFFLRSMYSKARNILKNRFSKFHKFERLVSLKTKIPRIAVSRTSLLVNNCKMLRLAKNYLLSRSPKFRNLIYLIQAQVHKVQVLNFQESISQLDKSGISSKIEDFFIHDSERIIFFYVEHTANFNRTTGIQRVAHRLAVNLLAHQEKVVLVKLEKDTLNLAPLSLDELNNFAQSADCKEFLRDLTFYDSSRFSDLLSSLKERRIKSWLVVPEVTYHSSHSKQPTNRLIKLSKDLGLKIGFVFYDSIPFISGDAKSSAKVHARYISSLALADAVWPISVYSESHLKHYFLNVEKFDVEELPKISTVSLATDMETPRQIFPSTESNRIILSVGTIDERKNQISLIEAFNRYCKKYPATDWQLYLVGLIREDYRGIIETGSKGNDRIKFFYNATDTEVTEFYKICDFTVFPSVEEGFGLPITESLWNFKPCVCANFGVMDEIAKTGGCLPVDTRDSDQIFGAIEKLIGEPLLLEAKKNEIIGRDTTTWFEYAGSLLRTMDGFSLKRRPSGRIFYWVDATIESPGNTGIQRVCRILARELIAIGIELIPIKWNADSQKVEIASKIDLEYLAGWNGPGVEEWSRESSLGALSENDKYLMVDLPLNRDLKIQKKVLKYFRTSGLQSAAIFYDAIPHKLSNLYPEAFSNAHREYMDILDSVDMVMAISAHSRKDLIEYINSSQNRGLMVEERVICVDLPTQFPGVPVKGKKIETPNEEICTILSVGTVEPRKNHINLIEAFLIAEESSNRQLRLVIIGSDSSFDRTLPARVEALIGKSKNIEWIKDANDDLLRKYYQEASFTVYPSFEEGFGLPIAESLWMGLPCICADFGQMGQLAAKGGCLTVDVLSPEKLSDSISLLANDQMEFSILKQQIQKLEFRTWRDYAEDIVVALKIDEKMDYVSLPTNLNDASIDYPTAPLLSIAITTYNRSKWLDINLENLRRQIKGFENEIEIVVCDNSSTDDTRIVLDSYQNEKCFRIFRNTANVGMLGNLSETTALANGDYIWLIGDDDLIRDGAILRVLEVIKNHNPDLIYSNYAYSTSPVPPNLDGLSEYHSGSTEMTPKSLDLLGQVYESTHFNENFYTAIYTIITKRKYAQKMYNQDTSGEPFSSLQTCVPTSNYILRNMLNKKGYWISEPTITINMNVSWGGFAPLWILERIPEVYDLAEFNGVSKEKVDLWRSHTLKVFPNMFRELFSSNSNPSDIDLRAILRRFCHLDNFDETGSEMLQIYEGAHKSGHPLATIKPDELKVFFHG